MEILASFAAFRYLPRLARMGVARAVTVVNAAVAVLFLSLFLVGSLLDGTLLLPGRGVGLLKHPTIFVFLLAQILVPRGFVRAVAAFRAIGDARPILRADFLERVFPEQIEVFRRTAGRLNNQGKLIFGLLVGVGLAAFVWNTFQNQQPFRFVGFDFWDSGLHPRGYVLTRLYKLYIWVGLIPACVHLQISLVLGVRRVLLRIEKEGALDLQPYDPDDSGGVKVLIDPVINPMVPVLLAASLLTISALAVHEKIDLTTGGALAMTCGVFIILYLVPAVALRRTIRSEKRRKLREIAVEQDKQYRRILEANGEPSVVKNGAEVLGALAEISGRLKRLPAWPQFARVARLVVFAGGSPVVLGVLKYIGTTLVARLASP